MLRRTATSLRAAGIALAIAGIAALPAQADMRSKQIGKHLCKTIGGGKFVEIPGFPGEKIDRRLIPDIQWMKRKYKIFVTDGYSTDPVHAANGEHPIGLAVDIIPRPHGGTWSLVGDLAHRFEPEQNHVRPPMRWVGWNGDPGHGRGNHLHLSWSHSDTEPRHPARVVYTRKCPDQSGGGGGGGGDGGGSGGGGGHSGGVSPRKSGGMTPAEQAALAPVVVETSE
jgi:hypothetical protein